MPSSAPARWSRGRFRRAHRAGVPARVLPVARFRRGGASGMKVLILTHRLPYAPNRGDRVRAYHIVKLLGARADVHVCRSSTTATEAAQADTLRQPRGRRHHGALVPRRAISFTRRSRSPTDTPLDPRCCCTRRHARRVERRRRDGVPTSCSPTAPASPAARWRRRSTKCRSSLDFVDVDSAKWAAFAEGDTVPTRVDLPAVRRAVWRRSSAAGRMRAPQPSSTSASARRCCAAAPVPTCT